MKRVEIKDCGDTIEVALQYPRPENTENISRVRVDLVDTRAAPFIEIEFDYERNGWLIRVAQDHPECHMKEAAFVPADFGEEEEQ